MLPLELRPMSTNPKHAERSADDVTGAFLRWLPSTGGRPFFAFLNLFDAHGPMPPPPEYQDRFKAKNEDLRSYLGGIRYMDDAIDRMLDTLAARGVLDRTIVVISSDHGEQFGEHGLRLHGNSLYRQLLHVPLVVLNAPGAARGVRVQHPVSLRDLPATLLDLAAVPHQLPGTSLRALLAGDSAASPGSAVLSELGRQLPWRSPERLLVDRKSLVDDSSHVIATEKGAFELFDYPADTAELRDRSGEPTARAQAQARLSAAMQRVGVSWRP
jgi:arylsulfatase A-like enzyme